MAERSYAERPRPRGDAATVAVARTRETAVKIDIGWPVDGVVDLVVTGRIRDDDGEVLAFALRAIPSRYGVMFDLRGATCSDARCRRSIKSALNRCGPRTPPVVVLADPAMASWLPSWATSAKDPRPELVGGAADVA